MNTRVKEELDTYYRLKDKWGKPDRKEKKEDPKEPPYMVEVSTSWDFPEEHIKTFTRKVPIEKGEEAGVGRWFQFGFSRKDGAEKFKERAKKKFKNVRLFRRKITRLVEYKLV